jgi:Zn-dependent peptidase ImmA (M78 family)
MSNIHVSTTILAWAAGRLGTSLEGLAAAMANPKRVENFMSGTLTLTQASELAQKLHIPFGYLFLESPPKDERPQIPDLRQTQQPEPLSLAFYEVLEDIKNKIGWYNALLSEVEADELAFVGKYTNISATTPRIVARDIASTIGFSDSDRNGCKDSESLYNLLASKFEAVRILVFRSGIAKSNTKRPLAVSEFRGFAIADKMSPAIFINGRDAPAAWTFTLVHEAAHIWLGQSGVSDSSASNTVEAHGMEAFCNKVAAEFLTPENLFLKIWEETREAKIATLARHFKVSRLVIARRALDFGLINREEYQEIHATSNPKKSENSGGNPYATIPIRSSKRFTEAVVNSAMTGETMLRDAGRLLNIKPGTVVELYKRRRDILNQGTDQIV